MKTVQLILYPLLLAGTIWEIVTIAVVAVVATALIAANICFVCISKKRRRKRNEERQILARAQALAVNEATVADATESVEDGEEELSESAQSRFDREADSNAAAEENYEVPARPVVFSDDEGDVTETVRGIDRLTGLAVIVRYKKSFTAKLIQSQEQTKIWYSALKNAFLGYPKIKSRVSWNADSFNAGRTKIAKLVMRGKTLCLYTALDPDRYAETKYKVERAESKKYADVPCLYRIKNERRAKYALDLIEDLAVKFGLERGAPQDTDYVLPYETTEALIDRGLIKELISKENYEEFMRIRSLREVDRNHRQLVSAAEVNAILADEIAAVLVETETQAESEEFSAAGSRKRGIINIDTLSENFAAGEKVTLAELKEKGLISQNTGCVKILARGVLDKPLTVVADDFSLQAVKMILLTGGHAKKLKK